jgi:putative transposase
MSTYTQIIYHVVFSTKDRRRVLDAQPRERFFRYVWGFLENKKCHLYRINAVEDHVHILTSLHPTITLSDLVHDLKLATSSWIKEERIFPSFEHWQDGYGAFTISWADRNGLIEYIKGQEEHHRTKTFREEIEILLQQFGVKYDERFPP